MLPVGTEAAVRRGSTKDYKRFYRGSTRVIKDVL